LSFDGAVKLVDFGIAKAQTCVEGTRPGVVKGKVAYMSPEQVQGMSLDGSSDVFSLGLVLWEMLAGRSATPRDNRDEAMRAIRDAKLTPIQVYRPDIPAPLGDALDRALAQYPHERATALELGLALERYLKSAGGISHLELAQWIRERFVQKSNAIGEPGATRQATVATRHAIALSSHPPTEISPPLFAPVNQTEIAVSVQVPSVRPSRRGTIAAAALGVIGLVAVVVGLSRESGGETSARPTASLAATDDLPPIDASAPATASLEVVTRPAGATVTVGDRAPIEAPVVLDGLEPGRYAITVALRGHAELVRDVELDTGERRTLELSLDPIARSVPTRHRSPKPKPKAKPGRLTIRTIPYSEVYLDGRKLGTTPVANIELAAGSHRLRFVNRAENIATTRRVRIRPGQVTRLSIKLRD
jgi:serine/threonine-protein kinase